MAWIDVLDYQCAFNINTNIGNIDIRTHGGIHHFANLSAEKYSAMLLTLNRPSVLYDPEAKALGTKIELPG